MNSSIIFVSRFLIPDLIADNIVIHIEREREGAKNWIETKAPYIDEDRGKKSAWRPSSKLVTGCHTRFVYIYISVFISNPAIYSGYTVR